MNSLERRLSLGLALSITLLMLLLWAVTGTALRHLAAELVTSRLAHDGESLLAGLSLGQAAPVLDPARLGTIYERPLSGHYYVVQVGDRRLRSRSLWDAELAVTPLPPGREERRRAEGPGGEHLLVWIGGFHKQGRDVTLVVAEDIAPIERRLSLFNWSFGGVSVAVLIALLIAQRLIVRRSLATLDRVRGDLKRLEAGEAVALAEEVPIEVRPLVQEVNRLLASNAARLARSRSAVGNLAHALKHPLALLQRISERLGAERHGIAPELQESVARLNHLVEGELKRARIAGGGGAGQRFVPAEELPTLAQLLRRIHHDKALVVDTSAPAGRSFALDRDDMLELIGNLLDNACKWACSRVQARVEEAGEFRFVVEDDGPGLAADETDALLGRGARLDESVPGHGLGLAIVADLVRVYGGRIAFGRSDLGGLRVEVELPTAGPAAG